MIKIYACRTATASSNISSTINKEIPIAILRKLIRLIDVPAIDINKNLNVKYKIQSNRM